jgi:hypothetical protein
MFALLTADVANQISVRSLKLSDEQIRQGLRGLRQSLATLRGRTVSSPFLDRAFEVLREVGPDKEASIFNALAEAGDIATLEAAARQFFPAELVIQLPAPIHRDALQTMPLERRAELIASRPAAESRVLLDIWGQPGAKLRDMIDFELQELRADAVRMRRAERNRDLSWKQYTETCRTLIRASEGAAEQAEGVLIPWLQARRQEGGLRAA